uniref:Ribosomal l1 domain-containing protein n=2 Tax=Rhodnius prolixus TaxID=13249 RepID=R4G8G9_RHOPR
MKTPKLSTPAPKSKLNTPRSGFIQKNSESSKKVKFGVLGESKKKFNGTPMLECASFKDRKFNNFSGKKSMSPFCDKINANILNANKKTSFSPRKRKHDTESLSEGLQSEEEPVKKVSPKAGNQQLNSPNSKIKVNKTSPEVQLGLDIEKYLVKTSSIKKAKHQLAESTPLGNKQQVKVRVQKGGSPKSSRGTSGDIESEVEDKQPQFNKKKVNPAAKTKKKVKTAKVDELVNPTTLKNAVNAILKYVDNNLKERKEIFGASVPFFMQVNFVKVPTSPRTRVFVPHVTLPEQSDICLFIADKKKNTRDPEDLIEQTKDLLKKCGVTCITEIMPWRQVLKEHTQYEQSRKLSQRFDMFLIDASLAKLKATLFDSFQRKKKPVPVSLKSESKVKSKIERAIRKIPIISNGKGLSKSVPFGHNKMKPEQLVENLHAILQILCDEAQFPGGRENIRSVSIKTSQSIAFPLYISTMSPNLVSAPKQRVVKEEEEAVEGELSTFTNCTVRVFKDGTVLTKPTEGNVKRKKGKQLKESTKKEIDYDELEVEDSDSDVDEHEDLEKGGIVDVNMKEEEDDDGDGDEDDDDENDVDDDDDDDDDDVDDGDEEEEEDSDEELELEVEQVKSKGKAKIQQQKNNKKSNKTKYESSSDEGELEEAEQNFLKELRKMQDEIESKRKESTKGQQIKKPQTNLKSAAVNQKQQKKNQNAKLQNEKRKVHKKEKSHYKVNRIRSHKKI